MGIGAIREGVGTGDERRGEVENWGKERWEGTGSVREGVGIAGIREGGENWGNERMEWDWVQRFQGKSREPGEWGERGGGRDGGN